MIKTRLQSKPLPGQIVYTGIINATTQIYKNEGMSSFWRGTLGIVCFTLDMLSRYSSSDYPTARVLRSAPQFAVTLLIYEMLQRIINIDFGTPSSKRSTTSATQPKTILNDQQSRIRPVELVHRIDHLGGLCLPRFKAK